VDGGAARVAVFQPGENFTTHGAEVRELAGQTLTAECAQLDFGDVQPTAVLGRVMDFQAFGQATGLAVGKVS